MNVRDIRHEFDLSFLKQAAKLVDSNLQRLELEEHHSEDPDQFGIYDRVEYITGFGLVACQTYITACVARTPLSKGAALKLGPQHSCGRSIVCLVNALANYWKHSPEWEKHLSKQAQETIGAIAALQVDVHAPYVAMNSLWALLRPGKPRIERLIPFLKQWHSALKDAA